MVRWSLVTVLLINVPSWPDRLFRQTARMLGINGNPWLDIDMGPLIPHVSSLSGSARDFAQDFAQDLAYSSGLSRPGPERKAKKMWS